MDNGIRIKICGLTTAADIPAALLAGAGYLGFAFIPRSPRNIDPGAAAAMAASVPEGICKVGLTVDADDRLLDDILGRVPLDMLQLHGREDPARVAAVRDRFRLPVMKAVGIADEGDLAVLDLYGRVADQILVDAKPPAGAPLPGGNGLAFDWRLIAGRRWPVPWMLAGGLHAGNVAEAVRRTGARQVDVSSGVEREPGVKDAGRIAAFGRAVKAIAA